MAERSRLLVVLHTVLRKIQNICGVSIVDSTYDIFVELRLLLPHSLSSFIARI